MSNQFIDNFKHSFVKLHQSADVTSQEKTLVSIFNSLKTCPGPLILQIESLYTKSLRDFFSSHKSTIAEIFFFCLEFFNFGQLEIYLPNISRTILEICPMFDLALIEPNIKPKNFAKIWYQIQILKGLIGSNEISDNQKFYSISNFLHQLKKITETCKPSEVQTIESYEFFFKAWLEMSLNSDSLDTQKTFSLSKRSWFFRGETLFSEENYDLDFKAFPLPVPSEFQERITKLFCAFLNKNGGRIYFGVTDEKVVKGIKVTKREKTDIIQNLRNLSKTILTLEEAKRLIEVRFIPILDFKTKEVLADMYIVKVIVRQGEFPKVYCLKQENEIHCFIRNNAMNSSRLDCAQLYKLMQDRRKGKKQTIVPSVEFEDLEDFTDKYNTL